jgi:hypothetical protein
MTTATSIEPKGDALLKRLRTLNHMLQPELLRTAVFRTLDELPALAARRDSRLAELLVQLTPLVARFARDMIPLQSVAAMLRSIEPKTPQILALIEAEAKRLDFRRGLEELALHEIPLVSIGGECMAYALAARWGFCCEVGKTHAFTPFSLAFHKPDYVLHLIRDGWGDYAQLDQLRVLTSTNGQRMVARKDGLAIWNHHVGKWWLANQFGRFRSNIDRHIESFGRILGDGSVPQVVFLFHWARAHDLIDSGYAGQLFSALKQRAAIPNPRLLLLLTPRSDGAPVEVKFDGPSIAQITAPVPAADYVWFEPRVRDSEVGLGFECRLACAMRDVLSEWSADGTVASRPLRSQT